MKRLVALCLIFVLFLSMVPAVHAYETPVSSSNRNKQDYGRWSKPITSVLKVEKDGYSRVEYVEGRLISEKYDKEFQFVSGKEIQLELPIFGGVYLCDDYNFVVVGQTNTEENDHKEVFRIIRYSKDWVRQDSASIYGANTTVPFDAGCLRFARSGNILYIRTSHEMYTSEKDGKNHQANVMIAVRISDMTVTDQLTEVLNKNYGYVSHSFNQFVLVDGKDLLAVDHGDAYPRSVVLFKYGAPAGKETFYGRVSYVEPLPIADNTMHYNDTGVAVGGFEASSDYYLIAGCSADQSGGIDLGDAHRNIFVTATPKNNFKDSANTIRWLTSYEETDNVKVSAPHLVKISSDRFFLIWTENYHIRYCTLNGKGALEGQIWDMEGALSDCVPVLDGSKIIWYVTNYSEPRFYVIDLDSGEQAHYYVAEVTPPTCQTGGYTTYTCTNCGDSYVDDYVDPVDHVYEDGECIWCGKEEFLATGKCGDNLTWKLSNDGTLIISGTGAMYDFQSGTAPWFSLRDSIRKLHILAGATTIGDYAFSNCIKLEEIIYIPYSTVSIGEHAFSYCTSLAGITIPDGITTIGESAFLDCDKLTSITIPESVTSIGTGAFGRMSNLSNFRVDWANDYYSSDDQGALYDKDKTILYMVPVTRTEYTAPDSLEAIGEYAFDTSDFTSVTLSAKLSQISAGAFWNCKIDSLSFTGDAPTTIEEDAFHKTEATVYYIANNVTWTADVMQQYGGSLTWVSYTPACDHFYFFSVITPPTCTEGGYTTYFCVFCGDSYVDSYTEPVEHVYEDGECIWCGDEESDGPDKPKVLLGDVDGNGIINTFDALMTLKYYTGEVTGGAVNTDAADVDGNGIINTFDALLILKYYTGEITSFPAEK